MILFFMRCVVPEAACIAFYSSPLRWNGHSGCEIWWCWWCPIWNHLNLVLNLLMIYLFLLRMSNAQYLMIWWCQHWPGMNQGSVGIDHLDPLVSWQDLMMNTTIIISMMMTTMTMMMMMTMVRRRRMMTKLNLNDDHLYSFLNHLSVRYLPNSSSWNITRFVKY